MQSKLTEMPVGFEVPEGTLRFVDWGGMTVETGKTVAQIDPGPLFKGLPEDRCQCPHWGFVIKGTLRYRFADHDELYRAGEVYYAAPGHLPVIEADTEYVEFSDSGELAKTMEVVERNMQAPAH
ncbi:MAG TPA: cupin domain-containing protein [Dehalococcoidia bacterium]|nr:cupin domain-containing protein [Dehalococcoidia bacterium]